MSAPRRCLPMLVVAVAMALLSACGGSTPQPQTTAAAYLTAWARQDWAAMRKLADNPPADFASVNRAALGNLSVRRAQFAAGTMAVSGSAASEPIAERLTLAAGLGAVVIRSTLHLVQRQEKWLVAWSPATIVPSLGPSDHLALEMRVAGPRGHPRRRRGSTDHPGAGGDHRRGGRAD